MLGSMIVDVLSQEKDISVRATRRNHAPHFDPGRSVDWVPFDAETDQLATIVAGTDWVINAIGIIKPLIDENQPDAVRRAIVVNSLFPFRLAAATKIAKAKVIQIATDCVFSGRLGNYREDAPHDPLDVYGKTKSLGEVTARDFLNLRCSIVGPELQNHHSLLDWLLSRPRGSTVKGFANHRWNGVTTLQFARIVLGLVRSNSTLSGTQHVVPADTVTKASLLRMFAATFERMDLAIEDVDAAEAVDRTLGTLRPEINEEIWRASTKHGPSSVKSMVAELAAWPRPVERGNTADQ